MKKVLIVDDDPLIRDLVAATLSGDPRYQVLQAQDGPQALEVARREAPDLVFLDIRMPGLDGYEVCRRLKADPATARAAVVMLTALTQDADRERGRRAGADDYFTKPFSPMALLDKVYQVLGL